MSYTAPTISSTGLTIPSYTDIRDELIAQAKTIFGNDVYLETDSADYQMICVYALKAHDVMNLLQLTYNNMSPSNAVGTGLSSIVKLNGLTRKTSSYSTCEVTLTGTASTVITSGKVKDVSGYIWDLPTTSTIGTDGTVTVTATCETVGAISAMIGDLDIIYTPTSGWTSVTNAAAASVGTAVELDSALRSRQAVSTETPSQTILTGTIAAIASLSGVTRYKVYENYTDSASTDPNGYSLPAHSITCVVEGGTDDDVADVIYYNRGLGCYTNGTTEVSISDPTYGNITIIRFYRPTDVPIYVAMTIKSLTDYTTATTTLIQTALVTYLNSLQIGETLTISALYGAALSVLDDLSSPTFSIRAVTAGIASGSLSTDDISVGFNEVVTGATANVTLTVTTS